MDQKNKYDKLMSEKILPGDDVLAIELRKARGKIENIHDEELKKRLLKNGESGFVKPPELEYVKISGTGKPEMKPIDFNLKHVSYQTSNDSPTSTNPLAHHIGSDDDDINRADTPVNVANRVRTQMDMSGSKVTE